MLPSEGDTERMLPLRAHWLPTALEGMGKAQRAGMREMFQSHYRSAYVPTPAGHWAE